MTRLKQQFAAGDRPRIELATPSGDIFVSEGADDVIEVTLDGTPDSFLVEQRGNTVVVEPQGGRLRVRSTDITAVVPSGTAAQLKCTSGDIVVDTTLSQLDAGVASGDIRVRRVTGDASLKTASGDSKVDRVDGRLEIASASGDARIGHVGLEMSLATASGDAIVDSVNGSVRLRTASGSMKILRFDGPDLTAKTISGNVTLGIPKRRRIDLDLQSLSGGLRNRLPEGDGSPPEKSITIKVKSVSGDLTLTGG